MKYIIRVSAEVQRNGASRPAPSDFNPSLGDPGTVLDRGSGAGRCFFLHSLGAFGA